MQRLKTRTQFQAVLAGQTIARTAHFALHCAALDVPAPAKPVSASVTQEPLFAVQDVWVGAVVPKRWARRSVTRNAIKRQIYTVSVLMEKALPSAAHVVRLRAGFDKKLFVSARSDALKAAVRLELNQLFDRLGPVMQSTRP